MSTLVEAFNKATKGEIVEKEFLVPLMIWFSGSEKNIESMQKVNAKLLYINSKALIYEVILSNSVRHFIRYPKVAKDDPKTLFFYNDLATYFGWTTRELRKNLSVLDLEEIKPTIASAFGYSNEERKAIGLKKIGGLAQWQKNGEGISQQT